MTRIMIVDDDADLLEILETLISDMGYEVTTFLEAKNALEYLSQNHLYFDLVISDIRMPAMNGIIFFTEVKKINNALPFIMMTGFSEIMDIDKAYQIGVTEFLSKPFEKGDLETAILLAKNSQKKQGLDSATLDMDYCRVHANEFLAGSKVQADIFLKLNENKYVLIAKKDAPLSLDRLEVYLKKGLSYLYIKKEDFSHYVGMNLKLAKVVINKNITIQKHKKYALLKHSIEVLVQDSYVNGLSKDKYQDAKSVVESTLNLVADNNDLFTLLDMLKSHSDSTFAHSLGVSMYSVLIAQHFGWTSPSTHLKITMAGLFHDIGKKELPQNILTKMRMNLTPKEIELLESHTTRGREILLQIPSVPEEVAIVAAQHHESASGQGYPNRLPRTRIHPIALLIGTIDHFIHLIIGPDAQFLNDPKAAILKIYSTKKDDIDLLTLKALFEIFKMDSPKDLENLVNTRDLK